MDITLSIVVPVYNEADVLTTFYNRLSKVLDELNNRAEIIFINDGSNDESLAILNRLRDKDPRIGIIDLSRNFGKEIAMTAGIDHAEGDAVVVIDADLQDPPELIPEFVTKWSNGYDVVYGQRIKRKGDTWLKKATAHGFYRLMQHLGEVTIPPDTGDFRLLSRRAVDALKHVRERHRFMKGLFTWIGFSQIAVPYMREPREAGQTKWNYWALWNFALEGITSFTTTPLKLATYLGLFIALGSFIYGIYIIAKTIFLGNPVPGYPSLMTVILFLGGSQLMAIGIVGEYIARMFNETKQRPLYFINSLSGPSHPPFIVHKPSSPLESGNEKNRNVLSPS